MTTRRLNRDDIARIVGNDARAIRAFERLFANVQANIGGPASVALNYASDGTLTSPLPVTATFTLSPEDGAAFSSGVSWGVTVLSGEFDGAGPTIGGTGSGFLRINSGLASPTATIAVTARIDGRGYPPFSVTITRSTAAPDSGGGGATPNDSTSSLITFNSGSFAAISRVLAVTLPSGVTEATLTAAGITLELDSVAPTGSSIVEMKWQRETAPAVWTDVGAVATSSPNPFVFDEGGGFFSSLSGLVTCNRTETGMPAASAQNFRLVARVSSGNVRTVYPFGTASVAS
jgi:hypothetical protein